MLSEDSPQGSLFECRSLPVSHLSLTTHILQQVYDSIYTFKLCRPISTSMCHKECVTSNFYGDLLSERREYLVLSVF